MTKKLEGLGRAILQFQQKRAERTNEIKMDPDSGRKTSCQAAYYHAGMNVRPALIHCWLATARIRPAIL
jgi:hypothetical protein